MAVTLGQMKQRILDDARDTAALHGTAVVEAIVSAIQFYENEGLWFNQKSGTLTLLDTTQSVALPSDFRKLVSLRVLRDDRYYGEPDGFKEYSIQDLLESGQDTTESGYPQFYAIYGESVYSNRIADDDYTLSIFYTYGDSSYPANDNDISIWFGDRQSNLIRKKAMEFFYRETLRDYERANDMAAVAQREFINLCSASHTRSNGRIM